MKVNIHAGVVTHSCHCRTQNPYRNVANLANSVIVLSAAHRDADL